MASDKIHVQEVMGNLDLDSPLEEIKNGDYVEAFNVSSQSRVRREGAKVPCVGVLPRPYVFRSKIYPNALEESLYAWEDQETILKYDFGNVSAILKQDPRSAEDELNKVPRVTTVYVIRNIDTTTHVTYEDEHIRGLCAQWEIMEMAEIPNIKYIDKNTSVSGFLVEGEPVLVLSNDRIGICELRLSEFGNNVLINILKEGTMQIHPFLKTCYNEESYAPPSVTCYAVRFKRADGSYTKFSAVTNLLSIPYSYNKELYGACNVVYTADDFNQAAPTIKSLVVPVIGLVQTEYINIGADSSYKAQLFATRFFQNDGLSVNESTAITHLVAEERVGENSTILFDGRTPPISTTVTWKEIKEQSVGAAPFDLAKTVCCKEGILYAANVISYDDYGERNDTEDFDARAWQFNKQNIAYTKDGFPYSKAELLANDRIDPDREIIWWQCDLHSNYNDMIHHRTSTYNTDRNSKYTVFGDFGYHGAVGRNVTIYFTRGKMDIGGVYPEVVLNSAVNDGVNCTLDALALDPTNKSMSNNDDYSSRFMRGLNAPDYDAGGRRGTYWYNADSDPDSGLKNHTTFAISIPDFNLGDLMQQEFSISDGKGNMGHSFANTSFEVKFKSLQHDSVYFFGVYFTRIDDSVTDIYIIGDIRTPSMSDPDFRLFDDHVLCEKPLTKQKVLSTLSATTGNMTCTLGQYTEIKAYPLYMYVEIDNIPSGMKTAHIVYKKRNLENMNVKATGVLHKAMKPFDKGHNGDRDVITVTYSQVPPWGIYKNTEPNTVAGHTNKGSWIPKGTETVWRVGTPPETRVVEVKGLIQDYYKNGERYSLTPIPHIGEQSYFYGGVISHCSTDEIFTKYRKSEDGSLEEYRVSNKNREARPASTISNVVINCPEERAVAVGPYYLSQKAAYDGKQYSFGDYSFFSGRKVEVNSGNSEDVLIFHSPENDFTDSYGAPIIPFDFDENVSTYFNGHGFLTSLFPAGFDKGMLSHAYSEFNEGFGRFQGMNLYNEANPVPNHQRRGSTLMSEHWKLWVQSFDYSAMPGFTHPAGVYDCLMLTNKYTTTCRASALSLTIPNVKPLPANPISTELYYYYTIGSTLQVQSHNALDSFKGNRNDSLVNLAGGYYTTENATSQSWKLTVNDSAVQYDEKGRGLETGVPPRCLKYFIRHTEVFTADETVADMSIVEYAHLSLIKVNNLTDIEKGIKDFDRQFKYLWPCSYNKQVLYNTPGVADTISAAGVEEFQVGNKMFVNLSPLWSGKCSPAYNDNVHCYTAPGSIVSASDRNRMHGIAFNLFAKGVTQDNMPSFPYSTPDALVTPIADHGDTLNPSVIGWYRANSDEDVTKAADNWQWSFFAPYSCYLQKPIAAPSSVFYALCSKERLELESFDFSPSAPAAGGHVYPDIVWGNWQGSMLYYRETLCRDIKEVGTDWDMPYRHLSDMYPGFGEAFNKDVWLKLYPEGNPTFRFNYWTGKITFDYFCGVNHHGWGGSVLACTYNMDETKPAPTFMNYNFEFTYNLPPGGVATGHHWLMLKDTLWDGRGRSYGGDSLYNTQHKLVYNDPRPVFPTADEYTANNKNYSSVMQNTVPGINDGLAHGSTLLMCSYRTPSSNYTRGDWDRSMWVETIVPISSAGKYSNGLSVSGNKAGGHVTGFDTYVGIHKKLYTHAFYPSCSTKLTTRESSTHSSPTIMMFPYEGLINVDIANKIDDILKCKEQMYPGTNRRQWLKRDVTYDGEFQKIKMKTDCYGYNATFSTTNLSPTQITYQDTVRSYTNPSRIYYSVFNYLYRDFDIFRPGNYCDLDGSYGSINNLHIRGNALYALQESAVAMFNPQMPIAISGGQGQPVIFSNATKRNVDAASSGLAEGDIIDMGDGSILAGRFQYLIKGFGIKTHNSDSVFSNDDGVYWIDTNSRSLLRADERGAEDIGKRYNIDNWVSAVSSIIQITPGATYTIYGTHDKAVRFSCTEEVKLINEEWYVFSDGKKDKQCIQLEEMGGGFNSFISFVPDAVVTLNNSGIYEVANSGLLLFEGGHNAYFLPREQDMGMSLTSFVNIPGSDVADKIIHSVFWRYKNASSIDRIIEARPHTPIGLTEISVGQVYHYKKRSILDKFHDGDNKDEFTTDMPGSTYAKVQRNNQPYSVQVHAGSTQQGYVSTSLFRDICNVGGMGMFVRHGFQTFSPMSKDEMGRYPDRNVNIVTPWKNRYYFYIGPFIASFEVSSMF